MTGFLFLLALQALPAPLHHALKAARAHNRAIGISRAQLAEQQAAVVQAVGALTPIFVANGSYLRSQYESKVSFPVFGNNGQFQSTEAVVIQRFDGANGNLGVTLPLLTPGAYAHLAGASRSADAARATEKASEADVLLQTARTYYQVVAAQGITDAALRALATAQDSLHVAETRYQQGTETLLTVDRARVDVYRAQQTIATSRQTLGVAIRSLETLTGARSEGPFPEPAQPEVVADGEGHYADLALKARPELVSAKATLAQQEAAFSEAWLQLAPKVNGSATEYFTNAAGFVGHGDYWNAGVALAWTIDPVGTPGAIRKAAAVIEEQRQRLMQSEDVVRDDVHTVWLEIEADRARLEETTSEAKSAREGLDQANKQFLAGTATSLDVSAAERDTLTAEANLAQAQSDLAGALLALRHAAGQPILEEP